MFEKWKNTLLNNKGIKEEIKMKNRNYLELNNILHIKVCGIQLKATFRGITIKTYIRRRKWKINRLSTKIKYRVNPKEIIKKGSGINKVENKKTI